MSDATELVIFDLDGTLVDSRADILAALKRGLQAVGAAARDEAEMIALVGRPLVEIFRSLLPEPLKNQAEQAAEVYRRVYFDGDSYQGKTYPGVIECLDQLAGTRLAIATTKPTGAATRVLSILELEDRFSLIQGSEGIPTKPDPAVLHKVLGTLGADPEKSWMVGDTDLDIQAGKLAGLRTCAVTYGFGDKRHLEASRPDLLLDSLSVLPARLRR